MRSNRWKNKDVKHLARSGKPEFTLPVGLADRVRAAVSAAPQTEQWRQPRFGNAKRLVFASALLVVLAVIAALALRSPDEKQITRQTAAVRADEQRRAPVAAAPSPRSAGTSTMEPAPIIAAHTGSETVIRRPDAGTKLPVGAPILRQGQPVVAVIAARQPATDGRGHALQVGDRLPAGAAFKTGAGGRLSLITRRGSEFTLDAESALVLASDGRSASLDRGRLYCRNREHEFAAISTVAGKIELLGTVVDAALTEKQTVVVTVVEGTVRLTNARGEALVSAGRKATLAAYAAPDEGETANALAETTWYDGRSSIRSDYGDIAYAVRRGDAPMTEIWAMAADGSRKYRVKTYLGYVDRTGPWLSGEQTLLIRPYSLMWEHPDARGRGERRYGGRYLLGLQPRLWLLNAVTGQDALLELPEDCKPQDPIKLSPEGTVLAFWATREGGVWEEGIYLYDLWSGQFGRLLDALGYEEIAWSPDSGALAALVFVSRERYQQLTLVNVRTGESAALGIHAEDPAFSPDGTRIAYTGDFLPDTGRRDGSVFVLDLEPGWEPRRVTPKGEGAQYPQWSPDGSRLLYWVWHLPEGGGMTETSVRVVAADGSGGQEVYYGVVKTSAWASDGQTVYVSTPDAVLLVAADGSGVIADLGGGPGDSVLSRFERARTEAAARAVEEAMFQYAVGHWRAYEGRVAGSRAAFANAASIFAGLPYRYPRAQFSVSNALLYADAAQRMADRPAEEVVLDTCRVHLTHLGVLITHYQRQHEGRAPASLAETAAWAKTVDNILMDDWLMPSEVDLSVVFRCPEGDPYVYVPPPGGRPEPGAVVLSCPRHPEHKVRWEGGSDEVRPQLLSPYTEMGWNKEG